MTTQNGVYQIKSRGRGLIIARLTKTQAKSLIEIMESGQMEFESIEFLHN